MGLLFRKPVGRKGHPFPKALGHKGHPFPKAPRAGGLPFPKAPARGNDRYRIASKPKRNNEGSLFPKPFPRGPSNRKALWEKGSSFPKPLFSVKGARFFGKPSLGRAGLFGSPFFMSRGRAFWEALSGKGRSFRKPFFLSRGARLSESPLGEGLAFTKAPSGTAGREMRVDFRS